jgi:hypothetical protein
MKTSSFPRKITMENWDYDKIITFSRIVNNDTEYAYLLEDLDIYGITVTNEEHVPQSEEQHDTN